MYTQQKRSLSLLTHSRHTALFRNHNLHDLLHFKIYANTFTVEISNCQNKHLSLDFLNYIKIPQIHLYPCLKHCLHFFFSKSQLGIRQW